MRLAEAALGVGLLLLPPLAAAATPDAPWVWALCCILGMLVALAVTGAAAAPPKDHAVIRSWYVAGTAVGQGFICWTAAAYAAAAFGGGRAAVAAAALALLALCTAVAVLLPSIPVLVRRGRLAVTIGVAVVWSLWPDLFAVPDGLLGRVPTDLRAVVFLLLISVVGWESARDIVGGRGERGGAAPVLPVALAGVVVLALTAGLAVLAHTGVATAVPASGGSGLRIAVSCIVFAAAGSYCVGNLQFAGRLLGHIRADLTGVAPLPGSRSGIGWASAAAASASVLAWVTGSGTWRLLLGPGSMTWAIFFVFVLRVLFDRVSSATARIAAAAAVLLTAWVATGIGPVLLFPSGVGLLVLTVHKLTLHRRRDIGSAVSSRSGRELHPAVEDGANVIS